MASHGVSSLLLLAALLTASFLLPTPVLGANDKEGNLLKGLNTYRTATKLPVFTSVKGAACLADEIADEMTSLYKKCIPTTASTAIPVTNASTTFSNLDQLLTKCKLDPKAPRDGIILPVCVPDLDETLVLTNYTHTAYATYINDSSYLRAGIGSEDDWMVVILTKNLTSAVSTSSGAGGVVAGKMGNVGHWLAGLAASWVIFLSLI